MIHRRSLLRLAFGAVAGAVVVPRVALGQPSPVRVMRKEPVVTRTEFDPRRPPANMPKLTPPEAGVCNTEFALEIGVGYSMEAVSATILKVFVDELDLVTALKLSIFTQKGSPNKLRAHEDGHRAIGEYYYKSSVKIAESVGKAMIGKEFAGSGANKAAAEQDGYQKINDAIEEAYMARTRLRALAANNRFDDITQHGLNAVAEADAIAMAVASDPGA
jgi:hypothetical protein